MVKLRDFFELFPEGLGVHVADEGMSLSALERAFPGEDTQKDIVARNILPRVLEGGTDRDTLRHTPLPATE